MSLYGINMYSNSNLYAQLLQKNGSNNQNLNNLFNNSAKKSSESQSLFDFMKGIAKTDSSSDLMTLAKNIDLVRSRGFQAKMTEEYHKIFSGEAVSPDAEGATVKADEAELSKAARALGQSSSKLATGNKEFYGNQDEVFESVQTFVGDYNKMLDALQKTESTNALKKGVSVVSTTGAYSKSLEKIGITVGKDNKLSVNEKKFREANPEFVKSMFGGSYSFASKTAEKANYIDRAAQIQQQTTYNALGKINMKHLQNTQASVFSSLYNQLF